MAILEDSPDIDGELLPASIAHVKANPSALALHLRYSFSRAAMGANGAIGPEPFFLIPILGFLILEVLDCEK